MYNLNHIYTIFYNSIMDNNSDIIYDSLLTGDLILYSGTNNILSNLVKYATSSIWSHVGIVIRDPDFLINSTKKKGLYLLNSTGYYDTDIECNTTRLGVQLVDLKTNIENYEGLIVARYLLEINNKRDYEENERRNKIFRDVYQTVYEKTYDYLPLHIIVALLHNYGYTFADNLINCRHTDYLFCSALVAYLYTITGIMEKNTKWSLTVPDFFSHNLHETFNFDTNGEYVLSPIIIIKNTFDDDWNIVHSIKTTDNNDNYYNIDNHIITSIKDNKIENIDKKSIGEPLTQTDYNYIKLSIDLFEEGGEVKAKVLLDFENKPSDKKSFLSNICFFL